MGVNGDMATYNLYTDCDNSPVNRNDSNGMFWKEVISGVIHTGNSIAIAIGIDTAAIGAVTLSMQKDSSGIYHANFDCWQQYFGYNDFYDYMFNLGTSMKSAKFPFSYNGTKYIIWAWKGDYINLGAGADLGIYYGGDSHWFVDKSLAIDFGLYLYYNGKKIISYTPHKGQWWITGFNPNYQNISAESLTASFTILFPSQGM